LVAQAGLPDPRRDSVCLWLHDRHALDARHLHWHIYPGFGNNFATSGKKTRALDIAETAFRLP
jgi:diadenosine tetraphosphate (Ap4A) HIT family hydrolase